MQLPYLKIPVRIDAPLNEFLLGIHSIRPQNFERVWPNFPSTEQGEFLQLVQMMNVYITIDNR